tara:strand:+ start:265 stop:477 length:213 start_codon:yes stop_codon:yes gene_type:complete
LVWKSRIQISAKNSQNVTPFFELKTSKKPAQNEHQNRPAGPNQDQPKKRHFGPSCAAMLRDPRGPVYGLA